MAKAKKEVVPEALEKLEVEEPKEVVETKEVEEVEPEEEVSKTIYEFDVLREHSRDLFGVNGEILDGAFYNQPKQAMTIGEAKEKVKAFLKKEVK